MKILADILYKCELLQVTGSTRVEVFELVFDSRKVSPNCAFVAIKGTAGDGHDFIQEAISKGAVAVICQNMPGRFEENVTYVQVSDSAEAMGFMAANYYDNPSEKLKIIGITGTNGKTTIATLLHQLFMKMGYGAGLISTVCNKVADDIIPATHTTPDSVGLNKLFAQMVTQGCEYCFMEVSSHAVHQKRIAGVGFEGGVFTNLTHDHLDYHKTFQEYLKAKKVFFDQLSKTAFALTNADDKNGWVMLQNTKAGKHAYGLKNLSNYNAKVIENAITGLQMQIDGKDVWCKLVGDFNAYNIMAIYGCSQLLGIEKDEALRLISELESVEGRFDYMKGQDNITGIVDYAHTPDALENVLKTLTGIRTGNEKVITVVGCGGNRDATKRPLMASIAATYSDKIILTSDNPRFEDPMDIINDMKAGLDPMAAKNTLVIADRREAIKVAANLASENDFVLVAGKGHEKYQEIQGVKHPFDDKVFLKEYLSCEL